MATMDEQETTITYGRTDAVVRIWSNIPTHLRAMRADQRFSEQGASSADAESGFFTVPREDYRPLKLGNRLTDAERARRAASAGEMRE